MVVTMLVVIVIGRLVVGIAGVGLSTDSSELGSEGEDNAELGFNDESTAELAIVVKVSQDGDA